MVNNTEEQVRKSICTGSFSEKNLFIEAGAGAGKTTLMLDRIMHQIESGIKIEKIVLITFTNAATNDLLERLSRRLSEEKKPCFQEALENIDRMQISTIHSFCKSMLMERPFDAKLDTNIQQITEEEEEKELRKFFMEYTMKNPYKRVEFVVNNAKLKTVLTDKWNDDIYKVMKYRELMFQNFQQAVRYHDMNFIEEEQLLATDWNFECYKLLGRIKTAILDALEELTASEQIPFKKPQKGNGVKENLAILKQEPWVTKDDNAVFGKKFYSFFVGIPYQKDDTYSLQTDYFVLLEKLWTAIYKEKKDYVSKPLTAGIFKTGASGATEEDKEQANLAIFDVVKKVLQTGNIAQELLCIPDCVGHYAVSKYVEQAGRQYYATRDKTMVTNNDLLYYTRNMLRDSAKARKFFKDKYDYLYIDEFQDTDYKQVEIMLYLATEEEELLRNEQIALANGRDIREAVWETKLRPAAVCVVGDPKQSIYAFRGADAELFGIVKAYFGREFNKETTEVVELKYNFRSNPEIIDWVNTEFQDYNAPMEARRQRADAEEKLLEGVYSVNTGASAAYEVANLIKNLKKNGFQIFDKEKSSLRPVEYSDFLVIMWNTLHSKEYTEMFDRMEIPYDVEANVDMEANQLLARYSDFMNYLAYPGDSAKLEKVLNSVYGLSFQGGYNAYMQRRKACLESLEEIAARVRMADEPIAKAYMLLEYPDLLLGAQGAVEYTGKKSADWSSVLQLLEIWRTKAWHDLKELAQTIEECKQQDIKRNLNLRATKDKGVKLMNLHKTKGLEGNIVILTGLDYEIKFKMDSYADEKEGIALLGILKSKAKYKAYMYDIGNYAAYSKYRDKKKACADAELRRLEYVAATRPKEALFFALPDAVKEDGKYPFQNIGQKNHMKKAEALAQLFDKNGLDNSQRVTGSDNITLQGVKAAINEAGQTLQETIKEYRKPLFENVSPSKLVHKKSGEKLEETEARVQGAETRCFDEADVVEGMAGSEIEFTVDRPFGNVFGTMMHRAFELAENFRDEALEYQQENKEEFEELTGAICERAVRENEADCVIEFAKEGVREKWLSYMKYQLIFVFFSENSEDEFVKTLCNSKQCHTEMPFYAVLQVDAQPKQFVHGIMDLVVEPESTEENDYKILDYKTNRRVNMDKAVFEKMLNELYEVQLAGYETCLKKAVGEQARVGKKLILMDDEGYKEQV